MFMWKAILVVDGFPETDLLHSAYAPHSSEIL